MNVIEINNLTKKFGDFTAVDHISFTVDEGEIFGLLGPNGAGKSTTLKILTTLLHPTSGIARVCGYNVTEERDLVRRCIGVVFQDPSSDRNLTGRQNLDFHARMYNMSRRQREERIEEVLRLLELKGKEDIKLKDLPEGLRRRFEVARGFMTQARVVFLDEPTISFDIRARMDLWEKIRQAKDHEGSTVILTTHYIEEADYLCDRVAIIDQAKIVAIDTPSRLKETVGTDIISLDITGGSGNGLVQRLAEIPWVKMVESFGGSLLLSVEGGDGRVPALIDFLDKWGYPISGVEERQPSLEDVFLRFTGRTIREAEGGGEVTKELRRARARRR